MRELERELVPNPTNDSPTVIVGRGRVGLSLARAGETAELPMRLTSAADAAAVCESATAALLCVPDDAIRDVCATVVGCEQPPALVGHVSGASTLEVLSTAADHGCATFSIHPLQTFANESTSVQGVPAAATGSDQAAESFAAALAERLGMQPFAVPEEKRASYHAAASIASNFLVALEESAAELLTEAGIEDARELLAPLVLRTAANWAERGGDALTGPIARGDEATIERHRAALAETAPELLPLYEALAAQTEKLAGRVAT